MEAAGTNRAKPDRRGERARGAVRTWLPLALLVVAAAVAALVLAPDDDRPTAVPEAGDGPPAYELPQPVREEFVGLEHEPGPPSADGAALPPDSPYRGRIALDSLVRGRVTVARRADFPAFVEVAVLPQGEAVEGAPAADLRSVSVGADAPDFRFGNLPFGDWKVVLRAPGYRELSLLITTSAEQPDHYLILPLQRSAALKGRVIDLAGRPVAALPVTARPVHDDPTLAVRPLTGRTEEDGTFAIHGAEPGRYRIWPGTSGNELAEPRLVQLAGEEAWAEFAVPVLGRALVSAVEFTSGAMLTGVKVLARLEGSLDSAHTASAMTGSDGRASFPHLPPGEYSFTGYGDDLRRTVVRGRVEPDTALPVTIRMRRFETSGGR
ncbi:MAG TPA: carboxypeptidase-like regulatory domain-containing protein [Planctomycetota bacterium]